YAVPNACRSDPAGDLRAAVPRRRADGRGADCARRHLAAGGLQASRRAQTGRPGARPSRRAPDPLQRADQCARPVDRLDQPADRFLGEAVRRSRKPSEKDGPMKNTATETRSVVVERDIFYPPEKLWRALTQPHLIEEWLMKNDFAPTVGHRFNLRGDWGGVLDCEVLVVEPNRVLSYTWNFAHHDAAYSLKSVVTFTLTPITTGTHLRMEQSGFRPDQKQAFGGAKFGWQKFLESLERVVGGLS